MNGAERDDAVRVLVCGDRGWTDRGQILAVLLWLVGRYGGRLVIVHGANGYDEDGKPSFTSGKPTVRGADMLAHEEAQRLGISVEPHPADWAKHGRAAGPIRNGEMLAKKPERVIAFHDNLAASRGTRDMIAKARAVGLKYHTIHS